MQLAEIEKVEPLSEDDKRLAIFLSNGIVLVVHEQIESLEEMGDYEQRTLDKLRTEAGKAEVLENIDDHKQHLEDGKQYRLTREINPNKPNVPLRINTPDEERWLTAASVEVVGGTAESDSQIFFYLRRGILN